MLVGSSNSNFRLTELASWEGLIAIGDMDRRVANDLRVGDGESPYGNRNPLLWQKENLSFLILTHLKSKLTSLVTDLSNKYCCLSNWDAINSWRCYCPVLLWMTMSPWWVSSLRSFVRSASQNGPHVHDWPPWLSALLTPLDEFVKFSAQLLTTDWPLMGWNSSRSDELVVQIDWQRMTEWLVVPCVIK